MSSQRRFTSSGDPTSGRSGTVRGTTLWSIADGAA